MPRHNRRGTSPPPVPGGAKSLTEQRAAWRGEDFIVRAVTGSDKAYRCPGCDQEIRMGQPHIVAWPAFDDSAADRRHWHHACWTARDRRAPGILRSRSAPRH